MPTTVIKNAEWAIVWEAAQQRQVYRKGIDVAFEGDTIVHVGPAFKAVADATIDGRGLLVMPGLVDIHSHPGHESVYRGIREEHGVANNYMTGLYERSQAFDTSGTDLRLACIEVALCELLKSGVTSICDIQVSSCYDGWAEIYRQSGMRSFLAPGYSSASWKVENDHTLGFVWDPKGGRNKMDAALAFIDGLARDTSGMLSGVVSPLVIENCTDDLLRNSLDAARDRKIPFTLHAAQGVLEVQEMIRRHGTTPIRHAHDIGILGPNTILGHAIFLDTHSWIRWWTKDDLRLLGESGCSVAHCPTPFSRYGHIMESFGAYVRAGVNMGIGTDTTPQNMLEEIRKAGTFARIASRNIDDVSTGMLFCAATVAGAKALLRDDIGRLANGAKADLVLVDLAHPDMMPARDPLRSLIFHAADRAVRDVYIAGRQVVAGGKVLTLDHMDAAERLAEAQQRMLQTTPQHDYRGRGADEIAPLSLPLG